MRSLPLLLAALLLGGCVATEAPAPSAASPGPVAPAASRSIVVEPAPPRAEGDVRGLAEPPRWESGEWWRVRVTERMSGQTFEVTRVVAGIEGDDYLVGMPQDAFVDAAMVLHLPGFGQVGRSDLGYEIHDSRFSPLRFPLVEGATWETEFEGDAMTATVLWARGNAAEVEIAGEGGHILLTYDATIGEARRLVVDGYLEYDVVAHGRGHTGIVTVPHMHDVVFNTFRFAGALMGMQPAPPVERIAIDDAYDRVSFAFLAGAFIPDGRTLTAGVFRERATAPDGTSFELLLTPADRPGEHIAFFGHAAPGGEWLFEHLPLGGGYVVAEGIAYHVYDVELPSGRLLEHAHGGGGA